jgi:hypothetical protein
MLILVDELTSLGFGLSRTFWGASKDCFFGKSWSIKNDMQLDGDRISICKSPIRGTYVSVLTIVAYTLGF